jgi:rhamnose transport system permease protein
MKSLIQRTLRIREVPVFFALVIVIGITGLANPQFFSLSGAQDILLGVAVIATLAVAQTLVIVMKHIDLSVGSTIGFSAYLIGDASSKGHDFWYCMGLALALGLAVGAANGFMVAYLKLPSLVVTLATLYIVRGLFNEIAAGNTITEDMVPAAINFIGLNTFFGMPYLFIIGFVLMFIVGFIMKRVRAARDLYAIGSNLPAAELVGIPVARRVFLAFLATGAVSGLAGAVLLARFNTAAANSGAGLELNVVAACVVGGVAIAGGIGTVYGAVIGAVLLQAITLALGALGIPQFWQQAVNGILLIGAISLDRYLSSRVKPTTIMGSNS